MTFEEFCKKRDIAIAKIAGGMTADDFADACWYDLYEDFGEDVTDEDFYECLAEADDIFNKMLELHEG